MLMFCVVVLYFLATGKPYPFTEKDTMPYDKRIFVQSKLQNYDLTDRTLSEEIETDTDRNTEMTEEGKGMLEDIIGNIVKTAKTRINDTVFNDDDNSTLTRLTQTAIYKSNNNANEYMTADKLDSKTMADLNIYSKAKLKRDHFNSYLIHLPYYIQKYVQKENPLKGFHRETIVVPGHRKQRRRRRSFYMDFDSFFEFPEEEPDVVFSAHTSPCDWSDRKYCLNGGTCVFVHALEIKTCR